jgi:ribosome-associated protein
MTGFLPVTAELAIPLDEIRFRYARSGGPGGQHVNKTETRVELLWDVQHSPSLSQVQRERLLTALRHRLDTDGILHLVVAATRSQRRNRELALARLVQLLRQALQPVSVRLPTTVPATVKAARLAAKRHRAAIKQRRRPFGVRPAAPGRRPLLASRGDSNR